ncbi:NAD(P)H-dependent oxidoreductase, partial [Candidatus Riflebacteria bacterium]
MIDFFIIFAHPERDSLNGKLLASFLTGCKANNYSHEILDLYKENFDPCIRAAELPLPDKSTPPLPMEIINIQKKIKNSRVLVFIFPVYWFSLPAILKGFFDRVFRAGFAFEHHGSIPKGILDDKKCIALNTYGSSSFIARWWMWDIQWRYLKNIILKGAGILKCQQFALYDVR